ncbi:glycosyltransferase [Ectothiorhodospira haloalkaliphila]|nr:glycosyltransferase [Ectothiorhodospira haloalkaliphila]MCG5524339.1 glycosyltransferase [Ectothiorhodospira haloalkaliphila]
MIAYHYPPAHVSSGVQRTLKFSRYLLNHGWHPAVLTVWNAAHPTVSPSQLGEIPDEITVKRSWCLDSARHLSIQGRHFRALGIPDRWATWILPGVLNGFHLIKSRRAKVIWSTYPIASAHMIGFALHKLTGLPWVADMRDPMTDVGYPASQIQRQTFLWVEKHISKSASRVIFTTEGARKDMCERYPGLPESRTTVIPNGYDELNFAEVEAQLPLGDREPRNRLTLLHSGVIYPHERDPSALFHALAKMQAEGHVSQGSFELILRGTAHDSHVSGLANEYGIDDLVSIRPNIPYCDALREMLAVDALVVMQAETCNAQIPAKVYEYLRAQKPVVGLCSHHSDTGKLLHDNAVPYVSPLDDADAIYSNLLNLISHLRANQAYVVPLDSARKYSREALTKHLADVLGEVSS